jgi:argininosuccinate synthase
VWEEGEALEDPWKAPDEEMFLRTVSPEKAPDEPELVEVTFEKGDPVAVNGKKLSPAALLMRLNELGGKHGIGKECLWVGREFLIINRIIH